MGGVGNEHYKASTNIQAQPNQHILYTCIV